MFLVGSTSEGKSIFDETVVKILDPFVGLNFTRELQDISSAVFQMKNEGICQFSWSWETRAKSERKLSHVNVGHINNWALS